MLRPLAVLLSSAALLAQQVPEAAEPNSTTTTATLLPCGAEGTGTLANATDVDWYRVTLAAVRDVRIETGPGLGTQIGDTFVSLLDSTGATLLSNDDGVGVGFYSQLQGNGLAAGTYYVAVERGANAVTAGSYALDVRCSVPTALPTPPIQNEGPESNDPRLGGTATVVTLPARCNGQITTTGPSGDWDFFRFTLANDSFVQVRVAATAVHPQTPRMDDPILYVFDTNTPPNLVLGPFYASNFGVWDTAIDARLAAGSWQVGLRGWVGSIAGRYYLDIHRRDAGRASVLAGGCGGRTLGLPVTNLGAGAPLRVERPVLGTTFTLQGSGLGSGGFAFFAVGFSSTFVDLTALGAPGCALEVVYADTPLVIADGGGLARLPVAIPENGALLGAALESQIAVLDFSNALGITLSNRVSAVLGN